MPESKLALAREQLKSELQFRSDKAFDFLTETNEYAKALLKERVRCLELSERLEDILKCLREKDLSDGAKLHVIAMVATPTRKPTDAEIAHAKTLETKAEWLVEKEKKA